MNKTILYVLSTVIVAAFTLPGNAVADNNDEAKIQTVIKKAFITEHKAHAEAVEHEDGIEKGGKPSETFQELEEYMSNKRGYLDHLKSFIPIKEGNEKLFHAGVKVWRFKKFDFKAITVDGDSATVEVDIYYDVVTHIGSSAAIIPKRDEQDRYLGTETYESPEHDVTTPGGDKHFITLERSANKWKIVEDKWTFLPEYRP